MRGDKTFDEHLAEQLKDPGYAAAWAVGKPFLNLCLNVWSLRETKGMERKELAAAAKLTDRRLAAIERDEVNPTLQTISRIAFALGVTADRLLAEPDEDVLAEARGIAEARVATWSYKRRRRLDLLTEEEQRLEALRPKRTRKSA